MGAAKDTMMVRRPSVWGFGSGSERYEEIDSSGNLAADQSAICLEVYGSVLEWGYEGCSAAAQINVVHLFGLWFSIIRG